MTGAEVAWLRWIGTNGVGDTIENLLIHLRAIMFRWLIQLLDSIRLPYGRRLPVLSDQIGGHCVLNLTLSWVQILQQGKDVLNSAVREKQYGSRQEVTG